MARSSVELPVSAMVCSMRWTAARSLSSWRWMRSRPSARSEKKLENDELALAASFTTLSNS
ncbi:MAG: hypothetical protein BRD57_06535 [Proteobacteria bacterium SW_6_67_9]|nr:MAG: hypothetical protein BRD57_06535 [Proteobacteria bacterium SW_6_67_9]